MLSKHCISITFQQPHRKARKQIYLRAFLLVIISIICSGCSQIGAAQNLSKIAQSLSGANSWQEVKLENLSLPVHALMKTGTTKKNQITIYIEGDGRAWLNRFTPSTNPTPRNPLALHLAMQDPSPTIAYIARPCQFSTKTERENCRPTNWTNNRFSPEIIAIMDHAVSQLKNLAGANKIILIGYSGGGTVATLIAALRDDVSQLITVAAVLDHSKWTELKQVSPLSGSLNPVNKLESLANLRQIHFVGGKDNIVPLEITRGYVERAASSQVQMVILPEQDHHCCWESIWTKLLEIYR